MSFESFYVRKSLYLIGQNIGKTDLTSLKFLCGEFDIPRRHLEKIQTAFELFCVLEEANKISVTDDSRLQGLLQCIDKSHFLERNPLNRYLDPLIQTDRGGKLPGIKEQQQLHVFLVKISNDMSNRDLRNLICFVYDLIPNTCSLTDMESITAAIILFKALIDARLIGPRNLNILKEIFGVIGRHDICQRMIEYSSCSLSVMTHDTNPVNPLSYPNSLSSSSQYTTSSSYTSSSSSSSISSPSTDSTYSQSLGSYQQKIVSIDHGHSEAPSAPPPPASLFSPVQPVNGSVGNHYQQQPIFHGGAMHQPPISPNLVPSMGSHGNPNVHVIPSIGSHGDPYSIPSMSSQENSNSSVYHHGDPNIIPSISNPYQTVPEPESFGDPNVIPTIPTQLSLMGMDSHNSTGTPILVSQSEQNLLMELMEKERLLKESDDTKAQLLSTMEFQRKLMNEIMKDKMPPTDDIITPQLNSYSSIYPMNSVPHGLAIVIGNETFRRNSRRPRLELNNRNGCKVDIINFESLFSVLQYDVCTKKDSTGLEIELLFDKIAAMDHGAYDSFVFCISSHGESNSFIFGSDSVSIDLYTQIRKIQACDTLRNKPKLFFIQACRVAPEDVVSSDSGGKITYNSEADVHIAWATTRDQAAYRSPLDGSWFVSALNHVLARQARSTDLSTMMLAVNYLVSSSEGHEKNSNATVRQCVETSSQLRGLVRFFP